MFSPALKVMRISYGLFWVALVITTGARAWVCHHVALRLIVGMWRAWRRSKHGVALEAGRNAQVGIPSMLPKAVQTAPHAAVRDETV
jgi:hypothetical protein